MRVDELHGVAGGGERRAASVGRAHRPRRRVRRRTVDPDAAHGEAHAQPLVPRGGRAARPQHAIEFRRPRRRPVAPRERAVQQVEGHLEHLPRRPVRGLELDDAVLEPVGVRERRQARHPGREPLRLVAAEQDAPVWVIAVERRCREPPERAFVELVRLVHEDARVAAEPAAGTQRTPAIGVPVAKALSACRSLVTTSSGRYRIPDRTLYWRLVIAPLGRESLALRVNPVFVPPVRASPFACGDPDRVGTISRNGRELPPAAPDPDFAVTPLQMLRQSKRIPQWPWPVCVALASSAAHAQSPGVPSLEVVRGAIEVIVVLALVAAFAVIILLARRSRRIDASLAACVKGRAKVEGLDRQTVPLDAGAQAIEAELARRGDIAKARAYAGRRAVPHAAPARPEWAEAYSIGLQLAAAGAVGVGPARELMASVARATVLPQRALRLVPASVINRLWPRADRVARGCESLEAAEVWARIAREAPPTEAKLLEEAATNASALFSEALRWLPDEDDVPVHVRKAEFFRARGQLEPAIAELDLAEAKIRKRLPAATPPAFGAYGSQARPGTVKGVENSLPDDLAEVIRCRIVVRLQRMGVPELVLGPTPLAVFGGSDAGTVSKIESDIRQLEPIKDRVSDQDLFAVRRAALIARLERWRGDTRRAVAAAGEVADVRKYLTQALGFPSSRLDALHLPEQSRVALDAECRWDRRDQLQLATLRLMVLETMCDEFPMTGASWDLARRRALEDFAAAVAFTWLLYDQRRIVEMPAVHGRLLHLSSELEQRVGIAGSPLAPELVRWMDYVRSRSQVVPQTPVVLPPTGKENDRPLQVNFAESTVASLLCRPVADVSGFGRSGGRIDVLADANIVAHDWSRNHLGGIDLVVVAGDGSQLRKVGVFGYPSAEVRFAVSVDDHIELAGDVRGLAARIASVDLGGISLPVPETLRFEVRTRQGARILGAGQFPSSLFRIAPPTNVKVKLEALRDAAFSLNELVAYLLKLSGKSYADTSGATTLRQRIHDELGDAVGHIRNPLGSGPPEVLSVDLIQRIVGHLGDVSESELQSAARRDWDGFRSTPELRTALEQVFRAMPSSVLSDFALSTIGLPRPGTAQSRPAELVGAPGPSMSVNAWVARATSAAGGDLRERFFRDVGSWELFESRSSLDRGLLAARTRLSMGGIEPARRSRLESLCREIEDLLG